MPRAFLKKKSLLDRFKDEYGHTNYIKSARAGHQWSNPIIRHKRETGANRWIKSFQGRRHVRKLSRFNALMAEGKMADLVCKYYGDTLVLPNGKSVKVYPPVDATENRPIEYVVTGATADFPGPYGYALYGYGRGVNRNVTIPGRLLCKDGYALRDYFVDGNRIYNKPTRYDVVFDEVVDRLAELYTDKELDFISGNYDIAGDIDALYSADDIVDRVNDWFTSNYED